MAQAGSPDLPDGLSEIFFQAGLDDPNQLEMAVKNRRLRNRSSARRRASPTFAHLANWSRTSPCPTHRYPTRRCRLTNWPRPSRAAAPSMDISADFGSTAPPPAKPGRACRTARSSSATPRPACFTAASSPRCSTRAAAWPCSSRSTARARSPRSTCASTTRSPRRQASTSRRIRSATASPARSPSCARPPTRNPRTIRSPPQRPAS